MNMNFSHCILSTLTSLVFLPGALSAQQPVNYQLDHDWLLDASSYKAKVIIDEEKKQVVLTNGLVERTIQTGVSATTTSFKNLMTGNSIIRALNPEAEVTINKVKYPVGGLEGQRNRAFLRDGWLDDLKAPRNAMKLIKITQGQPKERLAWKQVRYCAPDVQWPPKGVYLRMDYTMPTASAESLAAGTMPSDEGRKRLLHDDFLKLDKAWKIHVSKAHARSSFENEGKAGEIYTPANTSVYAERPLPEGTRMVAVAIHPGSDKSATWGPGMALVWPKSLVRFYIRPGEKKGAARYAIWDGRRESIYAKGPRPDASQENELRMRLDGSKLHCDARVKGGKWQVIAAVSLSKSMGAPLSVRIGKMDLRGEGKDFRSPGELVRLRIENFAVYGELDKTILARSIAKAPQKSVDNSKKIQVSVHYELYDGIPLISKWITVHNGTSKAINVDRFRAEDLSLIEYDNPVMNDSVRPMASNALHVETDMAFGGFTYKNANSHAVHWKTEKKYTTQVNWSRDMRCHLVVEPTYGPDQTVQPGGTFESFHVFELVYDSDERERRGLSLKRMYRTIAPWVTENPLMLHMRSAKPELVMRGIDQCAETGFELLILSFRSGFQTENISSAYLAKWKKIADYAHSKGIHIGSYSLLSSRNIKPKSDMIVSPKGQRPTHGKCPALTSGWGQKYFKNLKIHFEKTGFDFFEHDGSYPGDVDVTARPPLQKGINDSRWAQWTVIKDFYQWLRARGAYINVPDFYYLAGANKCGMGYRETNWALPRAQQLIHTRQNIYDGTWEKTPTMGWMFVPLTSYHGGGADATIEPLDEHRDHYAAMIRSNLGLGVQACYRGPRLYDTDRTRDMIKKEVVWYKKHRAILDSDMIHGRRADGRDLDWMLHVNPKLEEKGYLSVYNPTDKAITKTIRVPLYYTGIKSSAIVQAHAGESKIKQLDSNRTIQLQVTVPAQGYCGYLIKDAANQ